MQDGKLSGSRDCFLVRGGGNAEVEGTFFEGSETGAGCRILGTGTQVSLSSCKMTDNGALGLDVADGAVVTLRDCRIASNSLAAAEKASGMNAVVSGTGSRVVVGEGVEIGNAGSEEVSAFEGGRVEHEEFPYGDLWVKGSCGGVGQSCTSQNLHCSSSLDSNKCTTANLVEPAGSFSRS